MKKRTPHVPVTKYVNSVDKKKILHRSIKIFVESDLLKESKLGREEQHFGKRFDAGFADSAVAQQRPRGYDMEEGVGCQTRCCHFSIRNTSLVKDIESDK